MFGAKCKRIHEDFLVFLLCKGACPLDTPALTIQYFDLNFFDSLYLQYDVDAVESSAYTTFQ